jgi:hypothetical protein
MEECPHCGEPIDEEATFCHHCGSDASTGWKADTDYDAVELPEDEESEEPREPPRRGFKSRLRAFLGPALVAVAWVGFVGYGFSRFQPPLLVLIPAVYLAITIAAISRMARRSDSLDRG